tara:strand:- start:2564 stop:2791 length:228 start_codon:yes stop_codon:yes gene_type:complete
MKITKRQLKRIIREEKQKLAEEISYTIPGMDSTPYARKMGQVLQDLADQNASQEEIVLVLQGLIDNVNDGYYHED